MVQIKQASDRSITFMDHEAIRLFQMYREHRADGGKARDNMQYTDENEELRAAYNAEMGTNLDQKQFHVVLLRLLKKGENRIEPYLDAEGIAYASKN